MKHIHSYSTPGQNASHQNTSIKKLAHTVLELLNRMRQGEPRDQRREENTHASVLPLTERHVHIHRTQSEASSPIALYTAALLQRLCSNERTDHAETPPQATTMQTVLPLSKGPDRTKVPPARCSLKRIPEMQTVTRLFCLPRSQCLHACPYRRLTHVHLGLRSVQTGLYSARTGKGSVSEVYIYGCLCAMELQKNEIIDSTILIQNIEVACLKGNRSVETDQVDISWILTSHQTLIRLERNE